MSSPVLTFTVPPEWVTLSEREARTDLEGWAARTADAVLARRGPTAAVTASSLTAYYTAVGRHYLEQGGLGCFLLVPPTGTGVLVEGVLRLERLRGASDAEGHAADVEQLLPPEEWLVEPAQVDDVETAAGSATRVVLRSAPPGVSGATVQETHHVLWWFPDEQQLLLSTMQVEDVVTAGRWRDSTDSLLLSARRTDPGAASSRPAARRATPALVAGSDTMGA